MSGTFEVGAVLDWDEFDHNRPPGAEKKDKLLLVVGAKQGYDFLLVLATTKQHKKTTTPGCNAKDGYYYIPKEQRDFFNENTWLLLSELRPATAAIVVAGGMKKTIRVLGSLKPETARAVINCIKQIQDVSPYHLSLL